MSLNLLIETPGGFDYPGRGWQGWMRAAGFHKTWVQHLVGPDSVVAGIKCARSGPADVERISFGHGFAAL